MTAIPVLRCKAGVTFTVIAPGGFRILSALDNATKILGLDLVITAGTNDHDAGRHVVGEAFDISVRDLTVPMVLKLVSYLRQALGDRFSIFYETPHAPKDAALSPIAYVNGDATGDHLHIQVKRGTQYPPVPNVVAS